MRLPVSTMAQLLAGTGVQMPLAAPSFVRLGSGPAWPLGGPMSLSSPQAFVAEALLSRKLGLADALVDGTVRASLSQVAVAYDVVHDDEGGYENTLMLTMKCVLAESLTMPVKTASYSRLEWVASDAVGPAVAARDATVLLPDVPVWQICIHGLCVRSAAFALD
jgi:hypothetical protein